MGRTLILLYGIASYAIGMAGLFYWIFWIGGWEFLPLHIDSGTPGPLGMALAVNIGLVLLFGLQHSIMARPTFKKSWTKILPEAAERSTYVLVSGIIMGLICLYWLPIEGTLWHIDNEAVRIVLIVVQILGWTLAVLTTFVINHFELFGLQQIYCNFVKKSVPKPNFTERFFYKFVRHPLQLGFLIGMWSTPTMSMTHLMMSATMTIYVFIGLYYEERNLATFLGEEYEDYRRRVRKIIPIPK
jgi:protein-S-isoprenylcysteine O-methyltransferase Ste14